MRQWVIIVIIITTLFNLIADKMLWRMITIGIIVGCSFIIKEKKKTFTKISGYKW